MSNGADADLRQIPVVAEQLVLPQQLLDDLLGGADGQRAARRAQGVVLVAPGGRPTALAADPVHHRQVGLGEGAVRVGLGCADEGVGVNRDAGAGRVVTCRGERLAVQVNERRKPFRAAADDRDRERQAETAGAHNGLRRPTDGDPHRKRILHGARPHDRVLQRRRGGARTR